MFVSRLVGVGAAAHFELVGNGAPISVGANNSTRPDITFSGNTPYVSWREDIGDGVEKAFVGHFVNAASPSFVLDGSDVPLTPTAQADVREPISSSCTANPFNADGATCQGGAIGTPFFLSTDGTSPRGLFADAYQSTTPVTGSASAVTGSSATVSGTVNPKGAPVSVSFQFGATTAYGQSTPAQRLGGNDTDAFAAALSGLAAGAAVHYRAIAVTDFGTLFGDDQTLTTIAPTPVPIPNPNPNPSPKPGTASVGHVTVQSGTATVPVTCQGTTSCRVTVRLTVLETRVGHKIIAVTAARKPRRTHTRVVIGNATATLRAGHSTKLRVKLNHAGRQLVTTRHKIKATLTVTQRRGSVTRVVSRRKVTFKAPRSHSRHRTQVSDRPRREA